MALREPLKAPVLTHMHIPRRAQITLLDRDHNHVFDITVNLETNSLERVDEIAGAQPLIMIEEPFR